jgi:hypothetical protein
VICFESYLAGNHDSHQVRACYSRTSNCDCGDEQIWKPSGFCPHHPGSSANPDQDELNLNERHTFRTIFTVLLEELRSVIRNREVPCSAIIREFINLVSIGDTLRRCCASSFESFHLADFLMQGCDSLGQRDVLDLLELFGCLINDNHFCLYFGRQIVPRYPDIIERFIRVGLIQVDAQAAHENVQSPFRKISSFLFHSFHESLLQRLMREGLISQALYCDHCITI